MKKIALLVGGFAVVALMGAGCATQKEAPEAGEAPKSSEVKTSMEVPDPEVEGLEEMIVEDENKKSEKEGAQTKLGDSAEKAAAVEKNTQEASKTEAKELPKTEVKEFSMTAKKGEFDPFMITVNKGDKVLLHVKSIDVDHGFGLTAFGIDEKLEPGKTVDIEFVADKVGTHQFFCSVWCGGGHPKMTGKLIVE